MNTTIEIEKIIHAFNEGKVIQQFKDNEWCDVATPVWDFLHCIYRIKPEYVFQVNTIVKDCKTDKLYKILALSLFEDYHLKSIDSHKCLVVQKNDINNYVPVSFREYKNPEEFFNASKKYGPYLKVINTKPNSYDTYLVPTSITGNWVNFDGAVDNQGIKHQTCSFHNLLNDYTWQNEYPCGICLDN